MTKSEFWHQSQEVVYILQGDGGNARMWVSSQRVFSYVCDSLCLGKYSFTQLVNCIWEPEF